MAKISILSHRGGQTDYHKALGDALLKGMPAENTLAAFRYALEQGANGVELDVVRTKDDKLAIMHSAKLAEHVFNREGEDIGYIGDYTIQELKEKFRTGPRSDGVITELSEVIELLAEYQAKGRHVTLNIELKDVKGSGVAKTSKTDVKPLLRSYIEQGELNAQQIIVSSFALNDMVVVEKMNLGVKLAFLFEEASIQNDILYVNDTEETMPFSVENLNKVHKALPSLYAAHIEVNEVNEIAVKALKSRNIALSTWSVSEEHPVTEKEHFGNIVQWAEKYQLVTNIITNFAKEMYESIQDLLSNRS